MEVNFAKVSEHQNLYPPIIVLAVLKFICTSCNDKIAKTGNTKSSSLKIAKLPNAKNLAYGIYRCVSTYNMCVFVSMHLVCTCACMHVCMYVYICM